MKRVLGTVLVGSFVLMSRFGLSDSDTLASKLEATLTSYRNLRSVRIDIEVVSGEGRENALILLCRPRKLFFSISKKFGSGNSRLMVLLNGTEGRFIDFKGEAHQLLFEDLSDEMFPPLFSQEFCLGGYNSLLVALSGKTLGDQQFLLGHFLDSKQLRPVAVVGGIELVPNEVTTDVKESGGRVLLSIDPATELVTEVFVKSGRQVLSRALIKYSEGPVNIDALETEMNAKTVGLPMRL